MNTELLAWMAFGVMITGGFALAVFGLQRRPAPPPRPSRQRTLPGWLTRMPSWQRVAAAAAVLAGVGLATVTGWVILVVLLPLAVVGLPVLLVTSDAAPRIARMEAIAEWTRNLSGVLTAGQGMEQALQASLRSTPDAIRPEVSQLVGRLRARWSTETALRAFADDLDDATGDLVVAALILGSRKRGDGLARHRDRQHERGPRRTRAARPGRDLGAREGRRPDPRPRSRRLAIGVHRPAPDRCPRHCQAAVES